MKTMQHLMSQFKQCGTVVWIGLRPGQRAPLQVVDEAFAKQEEGVEGDRYKNRGGKRQVTLIQAEHLQAVASFLGIESLDPQLVRRNIVVRGINLLSLKGKQFKIGDAVLEYSGECHPCSRMEENLGPGGYNAMRGHGGITAMVSKSGFIKVGDNVCATGHTPLTRLT